MQRRPMRIALARQQVAASISIGFAKALAHSRRIRPEEVAPYGFDRRDLERVQQRLVAWAARIEARDREVVESEP